MLTSRSWAPHFRDEGIGRMPHNTVLVIHRQYNESSGIHSIDSTFKYAIPAILSKILPYPRQSLWLSKRFRTFFNYQNDKLWNPEDW